MNMQKKKKKKKKKKGGGFWKKSEVWNEQSLIVPFRKPRKHGGEIRMNSTSTFVQNGNVPDFP